MNVLMVPLTLSGNEATEGHWVTVRGTPVYIKEGQTFKDAISERFKKDTPVDSEPHDFGDGKPVLAHRHKNPGDNGIGGWVAETAYVSPNAFVGKDARVYDNAKVMNTATIRDSAEVSGDVIVSNVVDVSGEAKVGGHAEIIDQAVIRGGAIVLDNAKISGASVVRDKAYIQGHATIGDRATVNGNANISGHAFVNGTCAVSDNARVYDNAIVSGSAYVHGNAEVYGNAKVTNGAAVSGFAKVRDDAVVSNSSEVNDHAEIYDKARLLDFAKVSGNAHVYESAEVYENAYVAGDSFIRGNAKIYGEAKVTGVDKNDVHVSGNVNVCGAQVLNSGEALFHDEHLNGDELTKYIGADPRDPVDVKIEVAHNIGKLLYNSTTASSLSKFLEDFPNNESYDEMTNDAEKVASVLVDTWAKSSSDHNTLSLALQDSAKRQFNLGESRLQTRLIHQDKEAITNHKDVIDAFVKAVYDNTQKLLTDKGVKQLDLWRGIDSATLIDMKSIVMNPLSSFSTSKGTAEDFGDAIFHDVVPVKDIFSTWATGPGCKGEQECVVLGTKKWIANERTS